MFQLAIAGNAFVVGHLVSLALGLSWFVPIIPIELLPNLFGRLFVLVLRRSRSSSRLLVITLDPTTHDRHHRRYATLDSLPGK